MFRFTIRELVLLTLVVGLVTGWLLDRVYTTTKLADKQASIRRLVLQVEALERYLAKLDPRIQPSTSGSLIEGP